MKIAIIGQQILNLPNKLGDYEIVHYSKVLKQVNPFWGLLRAISIRTKSKHRKKFYEIEKIVRQCYGCNVVVLFDSMPIGILNIIMREIEVNIYTKRVRLFLYFWNKINISEPLYRSKNWECLTFDKIDSLNFGFRYIGTFYISNELCSKESPIFDSFFIGTNKGRFHFVKTIERKLITTHCCPFFIYVSRWYFLMPWKYSKMKKYEEVQSLICKSRSILDVTADKQFGLTLRFMEAIFYNKKIITNNKSLRKYNFFDEKNILIIDENTSSSTIFSFINNGDSCYSFECKKQYSFDDWLNRILDSKIKFNDTVL